MNPTGTERMMLARTAMENERRNKPTLRLVLAGLLVVAGGIYAAMGWSSLNSGESSYRFAASQRQAVHTKLSEISLLEQNVDENPGAQPGAYSNPITRLGEAATSAGLTSPAPPQTRTEPVGSGFVRRLFPYSDVRADTAKPLLEWLRRSREALPGLDVYALDLRPTGQRGWTMGVTFALVEKDQ